ncbi:armadillo-type protein [Halteromyces radiatus]|uniref:armadillo-type protein n=1 Tax=Halteromyces radiatus TaxID=101107 RepID=UPI002220D33A|nr:armadillo-type protein [Halteromyces radiatus]KAI8099471.1 armadillo-type protein [Halteromyces radiatus]
MTESTLHTSYLQSEYLVSGRSRNFYKFIKKVTSAKTKAEEYDLVNNELYILSKKMGEPDVTSTDMNEYLIELIHCSLLGYNVDMGLIYAIMTTQSGDTPAQRRVGYLVCTLLLNKQHDLGIMLINTLQRDLKSTNYLDNCAALNAICYMDHLEMADHLLEPTMKTMESSKQVVRKKGVYALYWFYRRSPNLLGQVEPLLKAALLDKDISVVFAALEIWKAILLEKVELYQDLLPRFLQIHQQILNKHVQTGFIYHGVLAPWAQITCLQIYDIYLKHNIGSQKELFDFVMKCLSAVENKVDAAYAIIFECMKLLSSMDTVLLSNLICNNDDNPFYILDPFLKAKNHTMNYLGLTALTRLESIELWHDDWKDGFLVINIILSCVDDVVVISKALAVLDICVTTEQTLYLIHENMMQSIRQSTEDITILSLSQWFLNQMDKYKDNMNEWWIKTMIMTLAITRNTLEDDDMETRCATMKQILLDDMNDTKLRTTAVDSMCTLLTSRSQNDDLSPYLVQFAFWTLGEYAYLSTEDTEIKIMEQLQKHIMLVQDPWLQVCGLQAVKRCVIRSKCYLSSLESILKTDFLHSVISEKREIAREMLMLLKDMEFVKNIQTRPNIPLNDKSIGKKLSQKQEIQSDDDIQQEEESFSDFQAQSNPYRGKKWSERTDDQKKKKWSMSSLYEKKEDQSIETSMISSLIDMEIKDQQDGNDTIMTTDEFGSFWLSCQHEHKCQLKAPSSSHYHQFFQQEDDDRTRIIRWLQDQWRFNVVDTVQQECLAYKALEQDLVLIHLKLDLPFIYVTLRSLSPSTLYQFTQLYHL